MHYVINFVFSIGKQPYREAIVISYHMCMYYILGYEPSDLTVHAPPPRTAEGGFIFFV